MIIISIPHFSYDRVGRWTDADASGSEIEFKYDALGRVIWESQNRQVIESEYDVVGLRVKRRSPSDIDFCLLIFLHPPISYVIWLYATHLV